MTALASTARRWSIALLALLALLGGCASVQWVSGYDSAAVERIDQIARQSLELFEDLLALPPERRAAAVAGPLALRFGKVETLMRMHLLRESARSKNEGSRRIARGLLDNWRDFAQAQRSAGTGALGDAALEVQRQLLERQLIAAYVGEEAKKLGGSAD